MNNPELFITSLVESFDCSAQTAASLLVEGEIKATEAKGLRLALMRDRGRTTLVLKGIVRHVAYSPRGNVTTLNFIVKGETIRSLPQGDEALETEFITQGPALLLRVSDDALIEHCMSDKGFLSHILSGQQKILDRHTRRLAEMRCLSVNERLVSFFARAKDEADVEAGAADISELSKTELGEIIGARREVVSRNLSTLKGRSRR